MRIVIPTIGTRGDVQPYIALAIGLQKAGYQPVIATHPAMRVLVESYGVDFAAIGPNIDIALETAKLRANTSNWIVGFMRVMNFSFSILEKSHIDLLQLCKSADAVLVSHTAAGSMEADLLDLPKLSTTIFPQAISAQDPHASWMNKVVAKFAGAGMGMMMSRPLNRIRKKLGIAPMGPEGITSRILNLVAVSPAVHPPSPFWETRHKITGYWFADTQGNWNPPDELRKFLDDGDPPVLISLGAMALGGTDAREAADITLSAIKKTGLRAIVQGWDEQIKEMDLGPAILHCGSIPHDWLLPRVKAVVHHGGFGTTAACFRAGVPAVVVPHIIDQFVWGQKVFELGVGPKPISRNKLNSSNLSQAIVKVVSDHEMRKLARDLGEQIRRENGVKIAVDLIQTALDSKSV